MEAEIIERLNIPFTTIPAAGIHGGRFSQPAIEYHPPVARSIRAMKFCLISTGCSSLSGGFVAVPMAVAGIRFPSLGTHQISNPAWRLKQLPVFPTALPLQQMNRRLISGSTRT
jgi:hypothetical protein